MTKILAFALLSSSMFGGVVTTYASRSVFNAVNGPLTVDDFGTQPAFPISTGVLNSVTNLVTFYGGPILPGVIQPGATYSVPLPIAVGGSQFNLDVGSVFVGAFLDSFGDIFTPAKPLQVTFDSPASAFGFDTNGLTSPGFNITINFASGPPYSQTFSVDRDRDLRFFGFTSSALDITSIDLVPQGDWALDNVAHTAVITVSPEPGTLVVAASAIFVFLLVIPYRPRKVRDVPFQTSLAPPKVGTAYERM